MGKKPLIASLSLHMGVFYLAWMLTPTMMLVNGDGKGSGGHGDGTNNKHPGLSGMNKTVIDKIVEVEIVESVVDKTGSHPEQKQEPVEKSEEGIKECKEGYWFGGIGIVSGSIGEILEVFKGYPAHKAGLKAGDYIVSFKSDNNQITGDLGKTVTLNVIKKDTQELTVIVLIREKICTEEPF